MKNVYKVTCLQTGKSMGIWDEKTVIGYAFELVKDRFENAHEKDDEFADWCNEYVSKGEEHFSFEDAITVMTTWEYALTKKP